MDLMDMSIKVSPNDVDKIKQLLSQMNIQIESNLSSESQSDTQQIEVELSDDEIDLLSDESEPVITVQQNNVLQMKPSENIINSLSYQPNVSHHNYDLSQMYSQQVATPQIDDEKITLNVGGKKFNIKKDWLEHLNINCSKLHKINSSGKVAYFMDRDPYYFSKIIELVKLNEMDNSEFQKNVSEYSEQLISELCFYKLLDNKYRPNPRLKLKRVVGFVDNSQHNNIVKIIIHNQMFETFESTLLKGTFFIDKLRTNKSNKLQLTHTDPKIFRHILNLLRSGNLYVHSNTIMETLNEYGIEYDVIVEKKIDYDIVPCHHKYNVNVDQALIATSQYIKSRYPDMMNNIFVDTNNIITTESEMKFDSNIIFNLNDGEKQNAINDMYICVDIPVINPTDGIEYIDFLEYRLIESVSIYFFDPRTSKTVFLMSTIPDYLYIYPVLYTENATDYHRTANSVTKKLKLIYNDTLIDIHRVTLPLFLFESSHLPIKKMVNNGILTQLIVKTASPKKIFKHNKLKNISL